MSELIEKRPLAYGFIEDGNLHSLIKWPFMEEVSVFQPVGKSLADFIRFDRDFMTSVFEILLVRYMQAKAHKNDYNFIAAVLWEVTMKHRLIGTNNYLTVYVLSYIHLLLEGEVDPRILVGEKADELTKYIQSLDFGDPPDDSFFAKQELTGLYMDLIEERQLNVEATLSLVLEQREIDGLTPIQRYYELEQTDEEFRKYWHSDFIMKLGKKADGYDVQHRRAYQRLNKWTEFGYMEDAEFKAWAKEAALRRKQC